MFNKGDIIETIKCGSVGGVMGHSYAKGTKAVVIGPNRDWSNMINVEWIRTNEDGTPVLDRHGDPLAQSDGGYYPKQFRLVKAYGEPTKKLKKLNV